MTAACRNCGSSDCPVITESYPTDCCGDCDHDCDHDHDRTVHMWRYDPDRVGWWLSLCGEKEQEGSNHLIPSDPLICEECADEVGA